MQFQIIQEINFDKARKAIKKAKADDKIPVFISKDDELTRKLLEHEKEFTLCIELAQRKDKLYQRDSGFNHVLAELANNNKVKIGIFLDEIIKADKKEKAKILARVQQNIVLCKKKNVKMQWIIIKPEFQRTQQELQALGIALGMHTQMAKETAENS